MYIYISEGMGRVKKEAEMKEDLLKIDDLFTIFHLFPARHGPIV